VNAIEMRIISKDATTASNKFVLVEVPDFAAALQHAVREQLAPRHLHIRQISWAEMPMKEQMATLFGTDILLGIPGSDVMNGVFLRDDSLIILPCRPRSGWQRRRKQARVSASSGWCVDAMCVCAMCVCDTALPSIAIIISVFVYIKVHIFTHICIYRYIYVYIRIYTYIYIYIYTHIYIHKCKHTYLHTSIYIYIYINTYTYIYMYIYIAATTKAGPRIVGVCDWCVCIYVCDEYVYIWNAHTRAYVCVRVRARKYAYA